MITIETDEDIFLAFRFVCDCGKKGKWRDERDFNSEREAEDRADLDGSNHECKD